MDIRNTAFEIYMKSLDSARVGGSADELKGLSPQETAFVKRLVMTALRRQEFIKSVIRGYAAKKIPARPDAPHAAIILGAVEVLYFHTPDYATVNSYVELAKKKGGKYAGGFVNAVLRKICRDRGQIAARPPLPFFPPAFKEMLRRDYSGRQITAIEKAAVEEPALDITVRADPEDWREKLGGRLMGSGSIRLNDAGSVAELPGFKDGCWWVQDFSAALPVIALGCVEGRKVLDLCAAPGGKTAQLIAGKADVTALDVSAARLKTMEENLARLHMKAQKVIAADALEYLSDCPQFDIVLLDAPCSADGTLRRHPEIVHTRTVADVRRSAGLQQKLLNAAAKAVAPGGILMYAVCSMSKDEGERQIGRFVAEHPDFAVLPVAAEEINPFRQPGFERLITSEGFIRCLPDMLDGIDGFFAARLQKQTT